MLSSLRSLQTSTLPSHLVQEDVVKLEIPVDDSVAVKEKDSDGNLCCVEPYNKNWHKHCEEPI